MPNEEQPDKLILRDYLAIERTHLANERTLLAYLRTGLIILVSAFTIIKVFPDSVDMRVLGYALMPIAIASVVQGVRRYRHVRRSIVLHYSGAEQSSHDE